MLQIDVLLPSVAMANTFQFNYKVSSSAEYIYDLNNINLSIKHMDLFHLLSRLHMPQYFFKHLLWSRRFLTI